MPNTTWNSDNLPTQIIQGAANSSFSYAPDKHRYKQASTDGVTPATTLYVGGVEIITSGGVTHYHHTISAYGRPVMLDDLSSNSGGNPTEAKSYLLTDHLGSVMTTVADTDGSAGEQDFDSFGRHRDPATWQVSTSSTTTLTKHGFTGHEHLDNLGLVHANGRVLDPVIGRFISVDPMYQAPTNSQSVNPYSYVLNNPLSLTDPSGYNACMVGDLCVSPGEHNRDSKGNLLSSDAKQMMAMANGTTAHIGSFVASKDDDGNLAVASDNGAKTTQGSDDSQLVAKTGADVNSPASIGKAPSGGDNQIDVTATDVAGGSVKVSDLGDKIPLPISDRNKEGGYGTPTEAALAQFHAYKPEYDASTKADVKYELTGLIYGNGSRDYFSVMIRVPTAFTGTFLTPAGYSVEAFSHTHPDNSTFGGLDYLSPGSKKHPSYMMNSDYNVFKWISGGDGNSNGAYEYGRSIGWMPGMLKPPMGPPNTPFDWGISPVGNANSGDGP